VLFNTAESNGKRQRRVRARYFDDVRGSGTECAACLDALVAKRVCRTERVIDGKHLLLRSVSMLTKLVQRFSPDIEVREPGTECLFEDEDENEDDGEKR
jgi:hypothetical protein